MSDSKRKIHWDRIREPKTALSVAIATAFGAGLSPLAPGTAGSLAALPLAWWTQDWTLVARVALWLSIALAGIWASAVMDRTMGTGDHQSIVIDEVLGIGITTWTVGSDFTALWVAFGLFRLFDVLKPPPVRQVDRWSKKKSSAWWGGFGVMADDALAALVGLAAMLLLQHFGIVGGA